MGLLGTRLLRRRRGAGVQEPAEPGASPPPPPSGPPLVLLAPDAAAVSSFRCHSFPDAPSAVHFIETALPPAAWRSLHAFWALQAPPDAPQTSRTAHGDAEAMILIRTAADSNQVYVVSFVDLASAHSFVRFEVKRGLDLGHVSIYWAHLAHVEPAGAGVRITPDAPPVNGCGPAAPAGHVTGPAVSIHTIERPSRLAGQEPAPAEVDGPELRLLPESPAETAEPEPYFTESPAEAGDLSVDEPEPAHVTGISSPPEAEVQQTPGPPAPAQRGEWTVELQIPEPSHDDTRGTEAETEIAAPTGTLDDDDVSSLDGIAAAGTGLASMEAAIEFPLPEPAIEASPELEAAAPSGIREEEITAPEDEDSEPAAALPLDEPIVEIDLPEHASEEASGLGSFDALVASFPGDDELEWPEVPAMFALDAPVVAIPGDDELLDEEWRAIAPPSMAPEEAQDHAPESARQEDFAGDLAAEVEKLLRNRRWQKRDHPFKGFDSPPGRF